MKNSLVVFAATLALGGSTLFGGQITQTLQFTPPTPTDISDTQSVVTFNDFGNYAIAGAILNSVTLEVVINETIQSLTITNNDPLQAHTYKYQTTGEYSVNGTAPDATNLSNAIPCAICLLYSTGSQTIAGGASQTFIPPTVSVNTDTGVLTSSTPNAYLGPGTFTLSYDTTTGETFIGGGGNEKASQTTVSSATYTVIYNYTVPTTGSPEPGTMALFGSALIGVGFIARKKMKRS